MVKSKKMSKTGIAVIVLAILLVLSMVMGMTGAWFTANDAGQNGSLKFSNVSVGFNDTDTYTLAVEHTDLTDADIMPGDTINVGATLSNYGEAVYVRISLAVASAESHTSGTLAFTNVAIAGAEKLVYDAANNYIYAALAAPSSKTIAGAEADPATYALSATVAIDADSFGNDWKKETLSFTLSVVAIQQANLEGHTGVTVPTASNPTAAQYQSVFAEYEANGIKTHA